MQRSHDQRKPDPGVHSPQRGAMAVAAAVAWAAGCYAGTPTGGASDTGSAADSDPGWDDGDETGSPRCGATTAPLRRLTARQYLNALEDIFPGHDFSSVRGVLPADPVRDGFENAADLQVPSAALIEGYQRGALAVTRIVFGAPGALALTMGGPMPASRAAAADLGESIIVEYGQKIFRRPLRDAEQARWSDLFDRSFEDTGHPENDLVVGISTTLAAMLQSPHFVYMVEHGVGEADAAPGELIPLTPWEVASRLSFMLWDSIPDKALFAAAEANELQTADQVEAQVRRMIEEPRARAAVTNLHRQWLGFDAVLSEMKDPATYPMWSSQTQLAAHEQLLRFVEHAFFEREGTLADLLTASEVPVHAAVSELLGIPAPSPTGWTVVELDPDQRRGVLTLPGLLAGLAHPVHPSPVLRGEFIRQRLLCAHLPPAPDNADTDPPEAATGGSNRDRYDVFLENPACTTCHEPMHGVGYPFEAYDAVGAFRTTDGGKPVDTRGQIVAVPDVPTTPVADALELVETLATSPRTHACVATQYFRSGMGRDPDSDEVGACITHSMATTLAESGGDLREVLVALARSQAFRFRQAAEES